MEWLDNPIFCLLLLQQAKDAGRITGILSLKAEDSSEEMTFPSLDALMQHLLDEYMIRRKQEDKTP